MPLAALCTLIAAASARRIASDADGSIATEAVDGQTSTPFHFEAVDARKPPAHAFPARSNHYMPPRHTELKGPRQTNKFWTNWISGLPRHGQKPIFTMPYALRWSTADNSWRCHHYAAEQDDAWCNRSPKEGNTEYHFFGPDGTCGACHCCKRTLEVKAALLVSHSKLQIRYNSESSPRAGRIKYYKSSFVPSISMGIKEQSFKQHYLVTREDLMGVHAVVRSSENAAAHVRFPVYRGMPYISARYEALTPSIDSPQGYIRSVKKIEKGVFEFKNDEGNPDKSWECHLYETDDQDDDWCKTVGIVGDVEYGFYGVAEKSLCGECDCCRRPAAKANEDYGQTYRAYVMDFNGKFVDGDFSNSTGGFVFNRKLHGWIRLAHIVEPKDADVYKRHAPSILESISLQVKQDGEFHYEFERSGDAAAEHFHWGFIHQKKLLQDGNEYPESQMTHIQSPSKGKMVPFKGTRWILKIDTSPAMKLNLLPDKEPQGSHRSDVILELEKDLKQVTKCNDAITKDPDGKWPSSPCHTPRGWIFAKGFYINGKGLQKLGALCLMSRRLFGAGDERTAACAMLLKRSFACHYDPSLNCTRTALAYYDQAWGGIVTRKGYDTKSCGLSDFGNACYNDHHYHYGYFIHAGAMLLQVDPSAAKEAPFVDYINSMVRDIANPSTKDGFFPQFRAFDFFDLHSWSHGVTPVSEGKDQESVSEEVNANFGIQMWGRLLENENLEMTGALLVSLNAHSASELFFLKDDNEVHPADYLKNRVTGIFFEGKVHYGTFFGNDETLIHGIQMLPLCPALRLARTKEFCEQEWNSILSKQDYPLEKHKTWTSLLVTGNLALHDAKAAYDILLPLQQFDRGLSKAWALYWTAAIAAEER